jgi:hypothetical protein
VHRNEGEKGRPVRISRERWLALDERALTKRVGLSLPEDLALEDWKRIGRQIFAISDASGWWLGDWLVYGQNRYPERYQRALKETGLDYQTLRNYAWVARRFQSSDRYESLSIQHHVEVAALPPADRRAWLDRAERFGWSRNRLREHVRASRSGARPAGDEAGGGAGKEEDSLLRLTIDPDRAVRWKRAADIVGDGFDEWAARVLDEAAGREDNST